MKDDGADEFHQVRADLNETLKGLSVEKYLVNLESTRTLREDKKEVNHTVQDFLDECSRAIKILQSDELLEKERQKHRK